LPAFASLRADALGWLWAEVFEPDPVEHRDVPRTWILFDPEGRARGTVSTPPGLEVIEVGADYVLGLWTSDLDVEQVRRHRLHRGEGL